MTRGRQTTNMRRERGQAMSELPGALMILILMVFFPLVNLLAMGVQFGCCFTLNSVQLREAALVKKSQVNATVAAVANNWKNMGLGKFVNLHQGPLTKVSYKDGQKDPVSNITDKIIVVETAMSIRPFLNQDMPMLPKVTGLNLPMQFRFVSERPLENHHNADN